MSSNLTLFVFGDVNSLNFEVSRTDDDDDCRNHMIECIETISHFFTNAGAKLGFWTKVTKEELDQWEETGSWSDKTTNLIKDKIKAFKRQASEMPTVFEFEDSDD